MRSGILFLVVLLALGALAALLWWRFKGPGKPAALVAGLATRNHHSLRTFHYQSAATAAQPATTATDTAEVGAALDRLLPKEDLAGSEPVPASQADQATAAADNSRPAAEYPTAASAAAAKEAPRPASIRHAAGALMSLLNAQEGVIVPAADAADPTPADDNSPEADEEPAAALFHNPITAPAPTANDQTNRAAQISLRQQRRARMSANADAQRAALSNLFPGAGSPIPTAKPS